MPALVPNRVPVVVKAGRGLEYENVVAYFKDDSEPLAALILRPRDLNEKVAYSEEPTPHFCLQPNPILEAAATALRTTPDQIREILKTGASVTW